MDRRAQMIRNHLASRGIDDGRVLDAFGRVPREFFVGESLVSRAYEDSALPIGEGQTISQPYIVALMVQKLMLSAKERVLEVGTGSGYAAAILSLIAAEVFTVERVPVLADLARARLAQLGIRNVNVREGDGSLGWPESAPFDAMLVSAAGPHVPAALKRQLALGGRLVMPIGVEGHQHLVRLQRLGGDEWHEETLAAVAFVPLIGEDGFAEAELAHTTGVAREVNRRLS